MRAGRVEKQSEGVTMGAMRVWGVGAAGLLAGLLGLSSLGVSRDGAADDKAPPAKVALPADLDKVPRSAMLFMTFRAAQMWEHDIGKGLRKELGAEVPRALKEARAQVGLEPAEIERFTLVLLDPNGTHLFTVRSRKPYDKDAILKAVVPGATKKETDVGTAYFNAEGNKGVVFLDAHSYLTGPAAAIAAITEKAGKGGDLTPALQAAAKGHQFVLGVNPAPIVSQIPEDLPPEADPFKPLMKVRWGVLTVDVADEARAKLHLDFATPADAKEGAKALAAAQKAIQAQVGIGIKELAKEKEMGDIVGLLKKAEKALQSATVKEEGSAVTAGASMKVEGKDFASLIVRSVLRVRSSASRIQSTNNLKQIAIAFHNYHDTMGAFPPAAVYDKDGKAILSWRVLILPYIEQQALYNEFRLNEPWDSAHNKKLLKKMPKIYQSPGGKTTVPYGTFYRVFTGKDTVFDGKRGIRIPDIVDGTSNTFLVVETGPAVPWSKPEELEYNPGKPLPKLGGVYPGGFHAGLCDGSVRFISSKVKESTLRALITRNGGEVIGNDF
jgi:hypothetical protein